MNLDSCGEFRVPNKERIRKAADDWRIIAWERFPGKRT